MTEREIFENIGKLSNNELDNLCNRSVFVKNTIMTNIIKHCRGEKKRGIKKLTDLEKNYLFQIMKFLWL